MKQSHFFLPFVCLAFAACQTTQTSSKRFDAADANHDGKLSSQEAIDFTVTTIFASHDKNQDQKMTLAEWNTEGLASNVQSFQERDANKDGVVTLDEAKAYAQKKGSYNAIVKQADTDKDGFVSLAEAEAYYGSKEGSVR